MKYQIGQRVSFKLSNTNTIDEGFIIEIMQRVTKDGNTVGYYIETNKDVRYVFENEIVEIITQPKGKAVFLDKDGKVCGLQG